VCLQGLFISFFPYFSLSPLTYFFIVKCISVFLILERVVDDSYDLRVEDAICDSLNYATFLNIFCIMLFYPFFYVLKTKKNSFSAHELSYDLKPQSLPP
jgi:hypothetical protein